jgi:hypothetical protein
VDVGAQEGMLDLNIVPFIGPQLPNNVAAIGGIFAILQELNIRANNDAFSMEISAAVPQVELSGSSINQSGEVDNVGSPEIVLALATAPTNLHLELQPHELDAIPPEEGQLALIDNQNPDQQHADGQNHNNIQQIGMALLPNNLDCDPGLSDLLLGTRRSPFHADGIRLWAKYFAHSNTSRVIKVPSCWSDFCTLNMLHPEIFAWVKIVSGEGLPQNWIDLLSHGGYNI